jgi:hypothetical protein
VLIRSETYKVLESLQVGKFKKKSFVAVFPARSFFDLVGIQILNVFMVGIICEFAVQIWLALKRNRNSRNRWIYKLEKVCCSDAKKYR